MKVSRTTWLSGALVLAVFLGLGIYYYALPRPLLLTTGDWRTCWRGSTYRLKFNKDGTLTVGNDGSVYTGTYTVSSQGIVSTRIMPVVPWGEVGNLRFSSDGNALISIGAPIGRPTEVIRFEHR